MKKRVLRWFSRTILILLALAVAVVLAGLIAEASLAKKHPAPGRLVDIGGYRLHLNCTGQGSPTVILEAGLGSFSTTWSFVQPAIAELTQVCSYDRAGYGWSEPSPQKRTAVVMAEELHSLLAAAEVEGPFVLVGHSLGGMLMRVYADAHPEEVVGMVLVDSTHEEQYLRTPVLADLIPSAVRQFRMLSLLRSTGFLALVPGVIPNPGEPEEIFAVDKAIWATTDYFSTFAAEFDAILESAAQVRELQITSFGDIPLSVLSAGLEAKIPSLTELENQALWAELQAMQSELVALSSNGEQFIAEESGHAIQLEQPELVRQAIRGVVEAVR
jgi:pimeloyl-ACP methyl ester carboxylesterase